MFLAGWQRRTSTTPHGTESVTEVEAAMVHDAIAAYQLIARNAAGGKNLDAFLRMMRDAHELLQETKAEAGAGAVPRPARFVPEPGGPAKAPPETATEGVLVDREGNVYEAVN